MITTILLLIGFSAGFLSGAVGFGGGMILLPILTFFFGIEAAVPISTISQLMSNLSKVAIGFKEIQWKKAGEFLLFATPLTAFGAIGFVIVPKSLMTKILSICLILFAIQKLRGKLKLTHSKTTTIIGGGITGIINGLLGISGPLSSAVFLTLGMAPIAYIATEATAASTMHIVKIIVYGKLNLVDLNILFQGLYIGFAMILSIHFNRYDLCFDKYTECGDKCKSLYFIALHICVVPLSFSLFCEYPLSDTRC
ncbi:MAG: sulfite exporter TauE/SafE family protein [Bacteroidales bacterium]|nr:sulfite exporter TauE/SafE family protein [Bacteroidales bacterium]